MDRYGKWHSLRKRCQFRSYSGLYFPAFGLNTERYSVSLRIQSKCGKIRTRITPNTDTFRAVNVTIIIITIIINVIIKFSNSATNFKFRLNSKTMKLMHENVQNMLTVWWLTLIIAPCLYCWLWTKEAYYVYY